LSPLFRPEAIEGQRQSWLGEVRLVRPLSMSVLTALALGVAALVVGFLFVATYTRQARLEGALTAEPGATRAPALRAMLYAPPATVGQLRADQPVRLRYEAFAGQPGGRPASGRILQVARTPATAGECVGCGAGQVWYRVTVALDAQSLAVEGREYPLAAGMRVDADVMIERRRLIEWLVEPSRAAARHGA
jgi:multidrug efflux pump subunit AcrA (membrane-fusion protein)